MHARTLRRLVPSLVIVGVGLGSSLVAYSVLVLALGVNQPLLLVPSRSMEPTIDAGDVLAMAFICLRQDAQCPSPWGSLSLIALGSAVAGDLVCEYWLSERGAKNKATEHVISRTEDAKVESV